MSRPDREVRSTPALVPSQRRPGSARAARGAVAATFATFVALASHVLAGGAVPGMLGIVVPLVFATSSCIALAGLRLSWVRLSVSVALSQLLFHSLFVIGAASAASVAVVDGADHSGHAGHGADPTIMIMGSTGASAAHGAHTGGSMWAAHALAALVTVVTLQRGEAVLTRLTRHAARLASVLLLPAVRLLVLPLHPQAALSDAEGWTPAPLPVAATGRVRRGPPALSLA